jgi:hypothetical protein
MPLTIKKTGSSFPRLPGSLPPSCLKRTTMKIVFIPLVLLAMASAALANTAPTVVIQSAAMRPGTTLMDVVYRVNDPDDATVKTRALAFVDGVRSFAKVIKPVTFVEGTAAKLGDAIPSNTNHTLTWDVAADWNIDLGQVKFEVLAMDARGLLPLDWITIPAAGGKSALAISKDTPTSISVLNALFWRYADGDVGMTLASGVLRGNSTSGNFFGVDLANGATVGSYAPPFVFKRMNLDPAESAEVSYASGTARAGLLNTVAWHATNRPYAGTSVLAAWGGDGSLALEIPAGLNGVTAIAEGYSHGLALKSDGTVVGWGNNYNGQVIPPAGLSGVTAIAAGWYHSLALKSDGTVVGWGANDYGQITIPAGLTGVTKISAYGHHNLALKSNGTVVGWGDNVLGEITIPAGLTGVIAISAGSNHGMALKGNGTVTVWGHNGSGQLNIPVGLTGVTAIAAGTHHCLALKNNGTVAAWGWDSYGQIAVPSGLTGVTAIAAGTLHSLALKNDGTVVGWGDNNYGQQSTAPSNLRGVTAISANDTHNLVLKAKAP